MKFNFFDFIFVVFAVVIINFTYHKIGPIKITEIIILLLFPVLFLYKLSNRLFYFLLFLLIILAKTLLFNNTIDDFEYFRPLEKISFFSKPYMISISRFVEMVCGVLFAHIVYSKLKNIPNERRDRIITNLILFNFVFAITFCVIFLLAYFDVIPNELYVILYDEPWDINDDTLRLRGFFIEGGPFGLMLSMVFCLTYYPERLKFKILIRTVFLITILVFAKSKAGFLCILFYWFYRNWDFVKRKFRELGYLLIIPSVIVFSLIFVVVSDQYIQRIANLKSEVEKYPDDGILLTGRTSGAFIGANMIKENPFFGIGLGNYVYNRNKEEYRQFVPKFPTEYVLPRVGLGGIFMLTLENGLFGLILFLALIYYYFKKLNQKKDKDLIVLFIALFLFGVEMTFLYPYFLLGVAFSNFKHDQQC